MKTQSSVCSIRKDGSNADAVTLLISVLTAMTVRRQLAFPSPNRQSKATIRFPRGVPSIAFHTDVIEANGILVSGSEGGSASPRYLKPPDSARVRISLTLTRLRHQNKAATAAPAAPMM